MNLRLARRAAYRRFISKMRLPTPKDRASGATADCLIWTGTTDSSGYGNMRAPLTKNGVTKAHRVAYWLFRGHVPSGLHLDHECRFRRCINPYHLRIRGPSDHARVSNADRWHNQRT